MTTKWVVNPVSGGGRGKCLIKTLAALHYPTLITTPSSFTTSVRAFITKGDTIIIAGGDGTVNLVINALKTCQLTSSITLAIYPLGTGNDLARSLKMPKNRSPSAFMASLAQAHPTELPLFEMNGHYFTNYVSIGFDALVNHSVQQHRRQYKRKPRLFTYLLYVYFACRHITHKIPPSVSVSLDNHAFSISGINTLIFSNIPSYAGGSTLGPDTMRCPTSSLNVFVLNTPFDYLKLMLSRFNIVTLKGPFISCKQASLSMPLTPIQLDGESKCLSTATIHAASTVTVLRH